MSTNVNNLAETLGWLEGEKKAALERVRMSDEAIDRLKKLFPAELQQINKHNRSQEAEKSLPANQKPAVKPTAKRSKAGRRSGISPYPGVTRSTSKSNPWQARIYDKKKKELRYLGLFKLAEEAAAAVAAAEGDKQAEQYYLDLAEKAENNPDRPQFPRDKRDLKTWECNKCGHRCEHAGRPSICLNCGNQSFIHILADGSGQSDLKESPDE